MVHCAKQISSSLYETIMPMVKQQVESQIKVRDFSKLQVSLAPADYESWHVARTETMAEAKAGLKAKLEAELSAAQDEEELQGLRDRFSAEERALEHKIGARHGKRSVKYTPAIPFLDLMS